MHVKKKILSAALALMLAGPMVQAVRAEVTVDFSNSSAYGLSEDLVQVNDILVTNIIENPFDPTHPELVEVSYNVPFRFDMASLHLIPDLNAAGTSDDPDAACATLTVNVSDAGTGQAIENGVVTLGRDTELTGPEGSVTFTGLPGGQAVMVDAAASGYDASSRRVQLQCGEQEVGLALNTMGWGDADDGTYTGNEVRIVLTWGEEPRDLDSHLTGPVGESVIGDDYYDPYDFSTYPDSDLYPDDTEDDTVDRFHVYFSNRTADVAYLDVDDTSSFGPETITISPPEGATHLRPGLYRYSVFHYSGSNTLATSQAQVQLYIGDTVRSFFPPMEGSESLTGSNGDLWTVFELMVDDEGAITVYPVNTYSTGHYSSSVQSPVGTATGMGSVETGIDFSRLPAK